MQEQSDGDVIVVVPGILGSRLVRGRRVIWGLGHALANFRHLDATLTADLALHVDAFDPQHALTGFDDGVRPAGAITAPTIIPGMWRTGSYDALISFLRARLPDQPTITFAYDWRQSNRVSARRMAQHVLPILQRRQLTHPGARLQLIGHSMGGLVARYFAEVLDVDRVTRRVITIGTTYSGAVKALAVLANGEVTMGWRTFDVGRLARSMPSMAELLPTYRCVGADDSSLHSLAELGQTVAGLPESAIAHAAAFHAELQTSIDRNGSRRPTYHPIVGDLQRTDWWARLGNEAVEVQHYTDFEHRGDGTVARLSGSPSDWEDDAAATFVAGKHATLHAGPDVLTHVYGVLTAQPRTRWMSAHRRVAADVHDVVDVDRPFVVVAEAADGWHRLQLLATIADTSGLVVARGPLRPVPGVDGQYTTRLQLGAPGVYQWTVAGAHRLDGVVPVSDVLMCVAATGGRGENG